jgi:threonine dehydratase
MSSQLQGLQPSPILSFLTKLQGFSLPHPCRIDQVIIGTALKRLSPRTRIVGVWPENSPCMLRAMEAGRIVDVAETATLSDGTAGAVEPGSITLPICRAVIDQTVTVSEQEISAAMRKIAETERWMVEGSAGVAVAGMIKLSAMYRKCRIASVLCGRNIALDTFLKAISG